MLQEDPSAHVRARLRAQIAALEAGGSGSPFAEGKRGDGGARCAGEACRGEAEGAPASGRRASQAHRGRDGGERAGLPDGGEKACPEKDAEKAFRKIERLACAREQASAACAAASCAKGSLKKTLPRRWRAPWPAASVDNRRYADVLVRSRLAQGKGRRGIAAELAEFGIDAEGVAALAEGGQGDGDDAGESLPGRSPCSTGGRPAPRTCGTPPTDASCRRGMALRSPGPPRADGANGRPAATGDPASGRLSVSRLRSLCGHPFVSRPAQQKPPFLDARPRPEVVRRDLKPTFRLVSSPIISCRDFNKSNESLIIW